MTGINLLSSLQTPAWSDTPATAASAAASASVPVRHARSRSQSGASADECVPRVAGDDLMADDDEGPTGTDGDDLDPPRASGATDDGDTDPNDAGDEQRGAEMEWLDASASYLCRLFQTFGESLRLSHLFQSSESLRTVSLLPPHHSESHWAYHLRGRNHFEAHDWLAAIEAFQSARQCLPGRENLLGVDLLSTALWHRGDTRALSCLSHEVFALDCSSPLSWIVVGNCFSLAKEHDLALKFFRRAIQLSPLSPIAYTLSAHEYISNEEFDRALQGYRLAISHDSRCYTAWFGLGSLYLRQEKFALALVHFTEAQRIHPQSSIIAAYVGLAMHALGRFEQALAQFKAAAAMDPLNPLPQYHAASTLVGMGRHEEALRILTKLSEVVPREANVHMMMGKILKKMGDVRQHMEQEQSSDEETATSIESC